LSLVLERLQNSPNSQVWLKHPLGSWFGWNKSNPPKPSMLQRQEMLSSKLVQLIDGNLWQIPIAHSWVLESGNLRYTEQFTRTLEFVDGVWKPGQIVPAQEAFANIGKVVFDAWKILRTVIDMDGYLDLQKKIIGDRSTSFGSEAGTLATESRLQTTPSSSTN
jgi:hypothetical protein